MIPAMRSLALCLLAYCAVLGAEPEHVDVQLNYYHQFQFAGLYAAQMRGYFADEALEVGIKEYRVGLDVVAELQSGRAHFGLHGPQVLTDWARGIDIGLVAVIHQRSPMVLLVREGSPWQTLAELLESPDARLVGPVSETSLELKLAVIALGKSPAVVFPRPRGPGDLERFAEGKLDALPAYSTNEPFRLRRLGIATRELHYQTNTPSPFFGDCVICPGDLFRNRPDLVVRFRRALLRGWNYALDNRDEVIGRILTSHRSAIQENTLEQLRDEAIGTTVLIDRQLVPLGAINLSRLEVIANDLRAHQMPGIVRRDMLYNDPDPSQSWVSILIGCLAVVGGACLALLGTAWITRRRLIQTTRTQQRIMDLAEEFSLFHARADGATGLLITSSSNSLGRILGAPLSAFQHDSDTLLQLTHPDDRHGLLSAIASAIADRMPLRRRFRFIHPDHQRPRHLLLHAMPLRGTNPVEFDGLVLDLTTETEATDALIDVQQRLEKTQRNESLGLLAGGVAHDFNNLLGGIRGNAELALAHLPPDHEVRPRINRLLQGVDRAAGLVRQILAYAGRGSIEIRPIDLIDECKTLLDLLKHSVPRNIQLNLVHEAKIPPILFDPAQLQQVLINLLVNAAESYQGRAGTVDVRLTRIPEGQVQVVIEDHGCGMDRATQARMFEPFFTTKKTGHGLGLAAVQGIITASGAEMECRSQPGAGTTFTLRLKAAKSPSQDLKSAMRTPPAGGTHILVVDDDELLREIAAQMARELGYSCDVAHGGDEAMLMLADPARHYDLVILDCSMPDRDGPSIVRELRHQGRNLPIVLVSGMMDAAMLGTGVLNRQTRFLAKPFSKALLDRTLRILLRTAESDDQTQDSFAAMQRESQVQQVVRVDSTDVHRRDQPSPLPQPPPSNPGT